ncbi:DHA2 family efflux MFS transporter permease subunit [Novosphingobium colocasiae]|uniref:MFS transporter n=1 Tax=Novosphingobium colocasiae TaxID=1256513 RepID=A0A918UHL5_9SPHN|nr:DHA2 family efflux MFS transporter permease subunit [Novosphingobium colocasiae]GGZ09841.1 MFS transporter [Novosphingobium colocasiae]
MAATASPAAGGAGGAARPPSTEDDRPVTPRMVLIGFLLALSNFVVTLDMTIANVSVPHIAGGMAVAVSSGTWVITSYAVAEAICVPLAGWMIGRFGAFRVLFVSIVGFGVFSALCGLATSLPMLVLFRLGQGFCGGPLMPLSQMMLMRVFPPRVRGKAMSAWVMTVIVAPILGPILGGTISDNWSWRWIFFINVPVVAAIFIGLRMTLGGRDTETKKLPIDFAGLALLVLWVGAFQLMLDLGRDEDWFNSTTIVTLGCIAAVGFAVFMIWELGEAHPVVDLKVFRHRGFSAAAISLTLAFGTYLASVVIVPQFLQTTMGYTATQAGYVMAFSGVMAIIGAPLVPKVIEYVDARFVVFFGMLWVAMCSLLRSRWNTDTDFWHFVFPQLIQGLGVACFMLPLTLISLSSVNPEEVPAAASIISFTRTISNAVGTATITALWDDYSRADRAELVGTMNGVNEVTAAMQQHGVSAATAQANIAAMVERQAVTLATDHTFALSAVLLMLAACTVWLAPKPARGAKAAEAAAEAH